MKQRKKRAPRSAQKKDEGPAIKIGMSLSSPEHEWTIKSYIGCGGIGAVFYKVFNRDDPNTFYALKTERNTGEKSTTDRVKNEAIFLLELREANKKKHLLEMFDRGQTDHFKFLVVTLIGPTLHDFRKFGNRRQFTPRTAIHICYQCTEAIRDLHILGWIHRDLQLKNFAFGLGDNYETIYLIDFGHAKRIYRKGTKILEEQAKNNSFIGSADVASAAVLLGEAPTFKDDLESLFHMFIGVFQAYRMFKWKPEGNPPEEIPLIVELKRKIMAGEWEKINFNAKMYRMPAGMKDVAIFIGGLKATDVIDYDQILMMLDKVAKDEAIDMRQPLDWIEMAKEDGKPKEVVKSDELAKTKGSKETLKEETSKECVTSKDNVTSKENLTSKDISTKLMKTEEKVLKSKEILNSKETIKDVKTEETTLKVVKSRENINSREAVKTTNKVENTMKGTKSKKMGMTKKTMKSKEMSKENPKSN